MPRMWPVSALRTFTIVASARGAAMTSVEESPRAGVAGPDHRTVPFEGSRTVTSAVEPRTRTGAGAGGETVDTARCATTCRAATSCAAWVQAASTVPAATTTTRHLLAMTASLFGTAGLVHTLTQHLPREHPIGSHAGGMSEAQSKKWPSFRPAFLGFRAERLAEPGDAGELR